MSATPPPVPPESKSASATARTTPDALGMGRTSGQRGAELLAGLRAELMPTPETIALARMSGRIAARIIRAIPTKSLVPGTNYISVRPESMKALVKRALPSDRKNPTIVEVAAGFSPRGLQLARDLPDAQVIEIDLPDVVQDKKNRLKRAQDFVIPPNIEWRAADLGIVSLASVLNNLKVEAICAEGLLPYFRRDDALAIVRGIRECLLPGGIFVTDLSWRRTIENEDIQSNLRFFTRQAGSLLLVMKDEEDARQFMREAGFERVEVYLPSALAETFNLRRPVLDAQLIVAAYQD